MMMHGKHIVITGLDPVIPSISGGYGDGHDKRSKVCLPGCLS